MKSLLLFLILTIALGQLSIVVESKRCGKNENTLTLEVRAEFYQKPLLSAFKYTKVIKASKSFKKTLTQMATSASVSGSYGAFSASASASYSSLKDSVISSEEYGMKEKKEETKYNPDFLQIFRKVETRLTVNEYTGSITEERIVDSKPKAEKYSSAELRKEAADYMAWEFGKEKVVKNKFTETVCTKIIENSEILSKKETRKYQIWTDSGSGAWRDFSCWNPRGDSMLASIPENGYDGNFKGYVFTGANGVLDKPRDYKLTWKDSGSWASKDVSFWLPICNAGYVALGDYCQTGYGRPSTSAMRCIRKDLTVACGKTRIWTDKMSGASMSVSVDKSFDRYVQGMITNGRQAYCLKN